MPDRRRNVQRGIPGQVPSKIDSIYDGLHLREATNSSIAVAVLSVCALNVACFVRYRNWGAAAMGIFAGIQITFFVTNAPHIFPYSALLVAYVGIATENPLVIAILANTLSVALVHIAVRRYFLGKGNWKHLNQRGHKIA